MLTCEELVGLLADYLDGSLDPETARALERHLEGCVSCLNFLKTYKTTTAWVGEVTYEEMPEELKDRLASFLRAKIRQEKTRTDPR
jgi:anti-sigma factor RsiW